MPMQNFYLVICYPPWNTEKKKLFQKKTSCGIENFFNPPRGIRIAVKGGQ